MIRMPLAVLLADRCAGVVPAAVHVGARGQSLTLSSLAQRNAWVVIQMDGVIRDRLPDRAAAATAAAYSALNALQDFICEVLTEQWPAGPATIAASPWTAISGTTIRLGFGTPAAPVVELKPIDVNDVDMDFDR